VPSHHEVAAEIEKDVLRKVSGSFPLGDLLPVVFFRLLALLAL